MYDGDTIFAMSVGDVEADLSTVGLLAARTMERAVISAVTSAQPLGGLKCSGDVSAS
jgi:L-aminopeptidase/D-esterase-like protein